MTAKWGMVSVRELAESIGITERAVSDLAARGIVIKDEHGKYDRAESVRAYCNHLREIAAGRGGEQAQVSLASEQSRLSKEQADGQAMKNATLRGELVDATAVKREWQDVLRMARSAMPAVPSRVHARLGHLTVADVAIFDREIRDALTMCGNDVPNPC